ncbi:hexose transporter [Filobasidium floriforme]|uniref:hexose transporter n=1 Tax=Filobasidium floriforme TaxID=5210 RepID=UPI001E8D86AD|nr:hexose transporter [Filobasidium floriforme]KAH8083480.1 hexose transporter [Filobasidium floriforme]
MNTAAATGWASKANGTHPKWWKDNGLRRCNFWIAICFLSVFSGGYDGSLLGSLQAMPQWIAYFDNPQGSRLGLMACVQSIGYIPGGPVSAILADRFGRRWAIITGALILTFGSFLQAFATNTSMFTGSRFLIGFGGAVCGPGAVLATELAHPRQRGPAVALYNTTYYIGSTMAAVISFATLRIGGDWSWRLPSLLQCAAAVVQAFALVWAPESPRFLVAKGKSEQAHKLLAKYHANGDMDDELVLFEMEEIRLAMELEKQASARGWMELVRGAGNRKRTAICTFVGWTSQFNGVGIVSYYFAPVLRTVGITNSTQILAITIALGVWNYLAATAGSLCVDKVGRRKLWLFSTGAMFVCMCLVTGLSAGYEKSPNAAIGGSVIAFLFLYYGAYDSAFTGLTISYPCEIMPYYLRTKGIAVLNINVGVALCVNQYLNPIALEAIGWKYYLVVMAYSWYSSFLRHAQYFPETRGYSIEEIAQIFDNKSPGAHELSETGTTVQYIGDEAMDSKKMDLAHIEGPVLESAPRKH